RPNPRWTTARTTGATAPACAISSTSATPHSATTGQRSSSANREFIVQITQRSIQANGIQMHVAEAGEGPAVLLCHGFPESWYSWRHQLVARAKAGYRAIAPHMRGYGLTDKPDAIDQYTMLHLTGDMVGVLDAL